MTATTATAAGLGQHLGISRQRVGQLADEGVIGRLPGGKFDLDRARLAYLDWLRSQHSRSSGSGGADRVRDVRAAEIEQRMGERARRHIKEANEQAMAVVDAVLGPLRTYLYAMPARITSELGLRKKLEDELDIAFTDAADRALAYRPDEPSQAAEGEQS